MITTYLDIKEKMINYIFDNLLVEIQMSHEKLVRCKIRKKEKKDYDVGKKMR